MGTRRGNTRLPIDAPWNDCGFSTFDDTFSTKALDTDMVLADNRRAATTAKTGLARLSQFIIRQSFTSLSDLGDLLDGLVPARSGTEAGIV